MKSFRQIAESDGFDYDIDHSRYNPGHRDFHDPAVHDLTHEVLSSHGLSKRVDSTGQHFYTHYRQGTNEPHLKDLHSDLESIGWEHLHTQKSSYDEGATRTANFMYRHPRHQRYLNIEHSGQSFNDFGEPNLTSNYYASYGGLRSRPDAS